MAKFEKKLEALRLRRKGMSVGVIAKRLNVSKSAASLWCQEVALTENQKKILLNNSIKGGMRGRLLGAAANHAKKLKIIESYKMSGRHEVGGELSHRDLLLFGAALYWAEGGKKKGGFNFVNSDPAMIRFMSRWLKEIAEVAPEDFMPMISVNIIHRERIEVILKFWATLLELPLNQFNKPFFVTSKQKKVYENHDTYYGVLALRVRKSSWLKYRILGLIDAVKIL